MFPLQQRIGVSVSTSGGVNLTLARLTGITLVDYAMGPIIRDRLMQTTAVETWNIIHAAGLPYIL